MNQDLRNPSARPQTYAYDIDGTALVHHREVQDWSSVRELMASCGPHHPVIAEIRDQIDQGHRVLLITARRASTIPATHRQMAAVLDRPLDSFEVHGMPTDEWTKMLAVSHKYGVLRRERPTRFMGDEDMDRTAAAMAGIPYQSVADFLGDVPAVLVESAGVAL